MFDACLLELKRVKINFLKSLIGDEKIQGNGYAWVNGLNWREKEGERRGEGERKRGRDRGREGEGDGGKEERREKERERER